jgi:hypothetical protein
MPKSSTASRQPVEKFTDGPVHVSIWENEGAKGVFRAATVQLRYKDEKKGWQTGTSYGVTDLEHLESAAREARSRIKKWQQENKTAHAPKTAA